MRRGMRIVIRHRVDAAGMQRMTAQDSTKCEIAATPGSEASDRGIRVLRAGRVKAAARWKKGADPSSIDADQAQDQSSDGGFNVRHN